ncbi:hypothetical protein [Lysinibacillus sp. NPDC059133]|uniref:hypothetical protein n=1 Tax=Lysinibacillus sp. NPDC059133 TaxID=3346737 RepID=UPI0036BE5681
MLKQLQTAYRQALQNLVFVDFVNKKVIVGKESLELEHSKENACCRDLITAINKYFQDGNFELVKERIEVLTNRADYANRLEVQIKEHRRNKLFEIASQLDMRGNLTEEVSFNASRS